MKIKSLFIKVFISLLFFTTANASSLYSRTISIELQSSTQNVIAPKTEIFIKNDSTSPVWISANGKLDMLINGFTLHLYNNAKEINHIHIIMSKSPISEVFFDRIVPNHSTLKVNDYLAK